MPAALCGVGGWWVVVVRQMLQANAARLLLLPGGSSKQQPKRSAGNKTERRPCRLTHRSPQSRPCLAQGCPFPASGPSRHAVPRADQSPAPAAGHSRRASARGGSQRSRLVCARWQPCGQLPCIQMPKTQYECDCANRVITPCRPSGPPAREVLRVGPPAGATPPPHSRPAPGRDPGTCGRLGILQ